MPQISYVHFHATGAALDLGQRLAAALALTATPFPVAAATPQPVTIDTATVFRALGPGRAQGAVAQVSLVLAPGTVTVDRHTVVPALEYGTPINIQAVNARRAFGTGDFAVLGEQVDRVLDAMAAHGITATAPAWSGLDMTLRFSPHSPGPGQFSSDSGLGNWFSLMIDLSERRAPQVSTYDFHPLALSQMSTAHQRMFRPLHRFYCRPSLAFQTLCSVITSPGWPSRTHGILVAGEP